MAKSDYFPLECQELIDSVGIIIKQRRLYTRMRQSDLAERVGVSVSTIRKLEAGERGVELGTLLHVLWQLGALREVVALDRSRSPVAPAPRRVRLPAHDKDAF